MKPTLYALEKATMAAWHAAMDAGTPEAWQAFYDAQNAYNRARSDAMAEWRKIEAAS